MEFFRQYFYQILWGTALLELILFYIKRQKPVRTFLLGSITGLTVLFCLHFFGDAVGFSPTLCRTNLLTCTLLGIPGAVLLILSHIFTK